MLNLGNAVAYLDLETNNWSKGMASAQKELKTLGSDSTTMSEKFKAAGSIMTGVGKTLTNAITLPVAAVGAISVKTAADFESSMSKVKAITGATGEDMQILEKLAREMGATTKFSASNAADALSYMGMA